MRSLGRLRIPLVILAVVLSVSVVSSAGSLSFTADRTTGLDVATDSGGTVGLDKEASVQAGGPDELVTVTNRLGVSASVAIFLSTTSDENGIELVYNGNREGQRVSLDLSPGESATIWVDAPRGTQEVEYQFEAETIDGTTQISTAPRTTNVQNGNGGGGGDGSDTIPPNASIEQLSTSQKGQYKIDVSWSATDNVGLKGGVDEVRLLDENGDRVDTAKNLNPKGTEASGTATVMSKSDPTGYTVELVITDSSGNRETVTETVP